MKRRRGVWEAEKNVAENAKRELPEFVIEYFDAGRRVTRKDASAAKLHQFRLLTKHLRYTLELFRPVYGPVLDGYVKQLRRVQTVLGELNDYESTGALVDRRLPECRTLLEYMSGESAKKRHEFRQLWTKEFDEEGRQERWIRYLKRYARDRAGV